jgi:predicted acylesterase/phospholipase RssA
MRNGVQRRPLRDFTIPRHSLIRGERFQSMLHRTFGTRLIEELPRGFVCCSADLRSRRLELARHGPLWEAVGLSINLPVIAPAQVRGRKILIDGSLIDNLPVTALAGSAWPMAPAAGRRRDGGDAMLAQGFLDPLASETPMRWQIIRACRPCATTPPGSPSRSRQWPMPSRARASSSGSLISRAMASAPGVMLPGLAAVPVSGQHLAHVIQDHGLARRPPRSRHVPRASATLAS